MKRSVYRAVEVNQVRWEALVADKPSGAVTVGLDIGKYEVYAVVRWADSTFERPWRVQNPTGIPRLIELLRGLGGARAGDGDRQGAEAPLGAPSTERSLDTLRPRGA